MKKSYLLIVFVLLVLAGCVKKKNNLYVIFNRVDGLTEGSGVVINGLTVGSVTSLDLTGRKIIAELELKESITIPTGSIILIHSNPLNNSMVYIEPSASSTNIVKGDTVTGSFKQSGILDNLLTDSASKEKVLKTLDKIGNAIDSFKISIKDSGKLKKAE